jgi:hypothetical protein
MLFARGDADAAIRRRGGLAGGASGRRAAMRMGSALGGPLCLGRRRLRAALNEWRCPSILLSCILHCEGIIAGCLRSVELDTVHKRQACPRSNAGLAPVEFGFYHTCEKRAEVFKSLQLDWPGGATGPPLSHCGIMPHWLHLCKHQIARGCSGGYIT